MSWLGYLLEANLYLLVFYGFYLLFLQRETFYVTNRYYLLITSAISFMLPILQVGILKPSVEQVTFIPQTVGLHQPAGIYQEMATPTEMPTLADILLWVYVLVAVLFMVKLMWDISRIFKLWSSAKRQKMGPVTVVNLSEETAFSFFNLLFVHPALASKKAVIEHEMIHIKQKHSVDVIFFELLQIISWFNPIYYFVKKDLKLVHEYIADERSTSNLTQKHEYAMFLIENSFGLKPIQLANQFFNQSILKRRINMLNKKRTVRWARLRLLLTIPLAGGMVCASTMAFTKDYGYVDLLPEKSTTTFAFQQEVPAKKPEKLQLTKAEQVKFPPPILKSQTFYYPPMRYNKATKKHEPAEVRYIVVNGKPITDLSKFYGAVKAQKIVYVSPNAAKKKYGALAAVGAVEITGPNVRLLDHFTPTSQQKKLASKVEEIKIIEQKLGTLKGVKVDSIQIVELSLSPSEKPKSDTVKILKVVPSVKNSKSSINLKLKDSTAYYLSTKKNVKVKKPIRLKLVPTEKIVEIPIEQKKNK